MRKKIQSSFRQKILTELKKIISQTTIVKLYTNQSKLIELDTPCICLLSTLYTFSNVGNSNQLFYLNISVLFQAQDSSKWQNDGSMFEASESTLHNTTRTQ